MHHLPLSIRDRLVLFMAIGTILSILFGIMGCGGGGPAVAKPEGTYNTGYFVDSPVEGLQYHTITWPSNITDSQGAFKYQDGEEITFSIGTVILGRTTAKGIITPADLDSANPTTSSTQVINISRLLITLDDDGNPDNGIRITQSVRAALTGISLDLNDPNIDDSAELQKMFNRLKGLGIYAEEVNELIPVEEAQTHLDNTLDQIATAEAEAEDALNNMKLQATIELPYSSVIMIKGQSLNLQGIVIGGKAPYTYSWSINNEKPFSTKQNPGNYTFKTQGSYVLTLTTKDSTGDTNIDARYITVFGPETQIGQVERDSIPTATVISPLKDTVFMAGGTVTFQATIYNGNVPIYYSTPGDLQNQEVVFKSPRTYSITQSIPVPSAGKLSLTIAVQDTGIDGKGPDDHAASVEINVK
jgi:hypothetical protein